VQDDYNFDFWRAVLVEFLGMVSFLYTTITTIAYNSDGQLEGMDSDKQLLISLAFGLSIYMLVYFTAGLRCARAAPQAALCAHRVPVVMTRVSGDLLPGCCSALTVMCAPPPALFCLAVEQRRPFEPCSYVEPDAEPALLPRQGRVLHPRSGESACVQNSK
jgi:Major intrinsic protein